MLLAAAVATMWGFNFVVIDWGMDGIPPLFFVAVRPGTFEFGPKGMMERGTVGKFIVESAGDS